MKSHCCQGMEQKANYKCIEHSNPFDCPDNLIYYNEQFNEYGLIIHDGGNSSLHIDYCPWCGRKLPDSKRDLWFDMLEQLGYDDPFEQDIPRQFKTDEWYRK